jgi:hypothetical protein
MFITLFLNFVNTKIVEADNRKRAEQSREKAKREAIRGQVFSMLERQSLDFFGLDDTNIEIHQWGCKPCFGKFYYGKRGF